MKICLIGPSYPFRGGISHYTTLLYNSLKSRHEVHFFAFKRQYPKWLFPGETDIDKSGKPIREDGVINILDSLNPITWFQVYLKTRKVKPELLILPWWVSFWAPQFWVIVSLVKMATSSKIVFTCHNVVQHESKKIDRICSRMVLKKGDHFIVHSKEDLENLKEMIPDADVRENFHPTYEIFHHGSVTKEKAQSQIGIKGNTLLFFGFVRPYKGLKYLIDAMPIINKHFDINLLIVGEFWEGEDEYRRQIQALGVEKTIKILNRYVPNEEVELYFAASDVVVLPYISATGSGIVQAAFGCNKPVITTTVGCLPEVVDHGKTGYLVPPKSPQAIADAVISFYKKGRHDEFVNNIAKEKKKFSWDRMVETIESFQ